MKKTYQGSCHCGAVRFEADTDLAEGTFRCNCSICFKSRAWMAAVPANGFRLLAGEAELGDYQFGQKRIHHLFCKRCGVRPFAHGSDGKGDPSYVIRVNCLDGVDASELANAPIRYFDMLHDDFKTPPAETRHLQRFDVQLQQFRAFPGVEFTSSRSKTKKIPMQIKQFLPALLLPVLAACGPGGQGGHGGFPPAQVSVMTVELKSLPASFEYTGQTLGSREVEVRARVTGILQARNFIEGGPVVKGQSLFSIDPAQFVAMAVRAEADVAGADARLAQARKNASRLKPLFAEKAVSQKEFDDATSAEAIADADLKGAKARLTEAQLNLLYTRVESPVTGVAGRAQRSEGSLVSGPDVLLTTVTQVDPIWVSFGISDNDQLKVNSEAEAGRLELPKGGKFEVSVKLADGTVYGQTGKLNFSDVRVSGATGTSETRAELPNPKGVLRPGQFVRVTLKGATRPNAVVVPQRAVLEGPQGKFVYILDEKSTAQPRPVQVGEWSGDDWIIQSGLKAGDKVIVDGVARIFAPGSPVQVSEPKKEEAPKK